MNAQARAAVQNAQPAAQLPAPPPLPLAEHPVEAISPDLGPIPDEPQQEHIPNLPLPEVPEMDADDMFFAGLSNTGPKNHELPQTLQEAFNTPEGEQWRAALEEELQNLRENCVYETVPIPSGVKPITSKPVLRVKFDSNGNIEHFKIRIVA